MTTIPGTAASRLDAALDQATDAQIAVNAAAGRRTVALAEVLASVDEAAMLEIGRASCRERVYDDV